MVDLRKGISILLIGLSLSFMFSFVRRKESVEASSQVIRVPKDFPTIGQAIGNASSGATLLVASGTYLSVSISPRVYLSSERIESRRSLMAARLPTWFQ